MLALPGYHFLVSEHGGAASAALLVTPLSDEQILDALEALGAQPGNGLGMDTWDRRHDNSSVAPDLEIKGPPIEILVRLPQQPAPLTLDELLEDPGGRGFAMRLGGHRANIHQWHSGCVICLYSCPGSKIGNARYTVRDFVRETTAFRVRSGALPPDGTEVEVVLRLLPAPEAMPETSAPKRPGPSVP